MSAEKYARIFSQQMDAVVFITIILFSSWSLWDMTQEHSLNLVLLCLVLFQLSIVKTVPGRHCLHMPSKLVLAVSRWFSAVMT